MGTEKGLTPGAHGICATLPAAAPAPSIALLRHMAPMLAADLEPPRHGEVNWMIGGLEAEQEQRARAVAGHCKTRLDRIDEAAVGGMQSRLAERAHAIDAE